jgi:hypothetical protein
MYFPFYLILKFMKKQIIFSFLASLFVVGGLSAQTNMAKQSTSQQESEATLGVRAADCVCEVVTLAAALKREIDAAPEDQHAELQQKAAKLVMQTTTTCMQEIELEIQAVPQEEQAEMEAEMKARMKVKCGDAMRELGMPEED